MIELHPGRYRHDNASGPDLGTILGKLCRLCRTHLSGNFRPMSPTTDFSRIERPFHPIYLVTDAVLPFQTSSQRAFAPGTKVGGASRGRTARLPVDLPIDPRPTLGKESR